MSPIDRHFPFFTSESPENGPEELFEASSGTPNEGYLEGQLLIATPQLMGSCFEKAVIYICAHGPEGAMGLIINRQVETVDSDDIFRQLDIPMPSESIRLDVHFGGPVDAARGFVLHSADYIREETLLMDRNLALTCNVDVLRDIAGGNGPKERFLALGYAGWGPGQLEDELKENSWLTAPATHDLIFHTENDSKWSLAAQSQGIDLSKLSGLHGTA